ncbi:MAG: hypothetical protein E7240_05950 [Lachnospiraceae bacterium]|nr:hypothetical protein [Lachnospiraceae bacterium]
MTIWEIIVIATGLSLDVYAYCLYKGAMLSELNKVQIAKMCGLFTAFQTAAVFIGSLVRYIPFVDTGYRRAGNVWFILSAALFFAVGGIMISRAARGRKMILIERLENHYNFRMILVWCLVASIDAFIAGIGFAVLSAELLQLLIVTALTSVIAVVGGIYAGYRLGCASRNRFVTIGGCILLAGGADVLLRFFMA